MISLREWFSRYGQRPLFLVAGLVYAAAFFYLYRTHSERLSSDDRILKQLSESVGLALSQKNRTLLESLLEMTHWQLGANSAQLFFKNNPLLTTDSPRRKNLLVQRRILPIPGFEDYQLEVDIPSPFLRDGYPFAVGLELVVVIASAVIFSRVRNRFVADILSPMQAGLDAAEPIGISELDRIRANQREANELRVQNAIARGVLANNQQIVHDIRSPLAALSILSDASSFPAENERLLFRSAMNRICEIVDKLSERTWTSANGSPDAKTSVLNTQPIALLVDSVVSEKRVEYRRLLQVEITTDLNSGYGVFCDVDPTELRRAISNLVNNSVEALEQKGKVHVAVRRREEQALISVSDTGKGIPESNLVRLGKQGATFGKAGGSGLGLYHAKTIAETWGGGLEVSSSLGSGTKVIIELPCSPEPKWFLPELHLDLGIEVVVIDDDSSMHQLWNHRLVEIGAAKPTHLFSANDLRGWIEAHQDDKAIFLMDYELLDGTENGLDLIEKVLFPKKCLLVTSHFEEPDVKERLIRLGSHLLPKPWVNAIPISTSTRKTLLVAGFEEKLMLENRRFQSSQ